ncbi:hypothetical protein ACFYVR_16135 [Rhodococcus sp. NPDC003318]|uniref:hypothetical protein n=1 Tax=Rhodococcus sp. NPDC003318 TaxID=3364503 RepID=UPI003695318A
MRTYLSRMHLGRALGDLGVACDLPTVNENPLGDRVLELVRFDQYSGAEQLAEKVHSIFSSDQDEAKDLYTGITEASANVCEHSGQSGGWAALQQYREGSTHRVCFAVADSGRGLRSTLSAQHHVEDDADALRLAITRGVSGTGKANRGLGLESIVTRARQRGGWVYLWSGRATGLTGNTADSLYPKTRSYSYPGTIVYATLTYNMGGDQK